MSGSEATAKSSSKSSSRKGRRISNSLLRQGCRSNQGAIIVVLSIKYEITSSPEFIQNAAVFLYGLGKYASNTPGIPMLQHRLFYQSTATLVLLAVSAMTAFAQPDTAANLDFYLGQALRSSPLLKDYRNQVQLGQIDSQLIHASYLPQVAGNSTNIYAPSYRGWAYDEAISNGGNFTTVVAVTKTLVSQKHLDAEYETVRLNNQGISNTSRISEQDLKRSVTAQYITT